MSNMILRKWPIEEYETLNALGNAYATTIHCLVSGITKISKVTKIDENLKLYRGFGGVKLPEAFYKPPQGGLYKGVVEWGFMSTTTNKAVAINYSGISRGKSYPTLFLIHPAAVDHGADIKEYSQYPDEREYLWNPCSLIEAQGDSYVEVTADGILTIIPVRMNNNVKTLTLEELLDQKKKMHLSSFEIIINEIIEDLDKLADANETSIRIKKKITEDPNTSVEANETLIKLKKKENSKEQSRLVQFFIEGIIFECKEKYKRHQAKDAKDYANDPQYQQLVMEMLETKSSALSKKELCETALKQLRTGRTTVMLVSDQGDVSRLKELLAAHPNSVEEEADETKKTALHIAAKRGHEHIVDLLLEKKAKPNAQDYLGATALHVAVQAKNVNIVRALLNAGAFLDIKDKYEKTALDLAEQISGDINKDEEDDNEPLNRTRLLNQDHDGKRENRMSRNARRQQEAGVNACRNELIWRGAGGWTPLMVASELGAHEVKIILNTHKAITAIKKQEKFDAWFIEEVRDLSDRHRWKRKSWGWGAHEPNSIRIDGFSARKYKDKPNSDFSCVLANEELDGMGTHVWEIKVSDVQCIWLGIARGVEKHQGLDSMAGMDDPADYMLAIGNAGQVVSLGQLPQIGTNEVKISSGQTIQFRLDTSKNELQVIIERKVVFTASNVESQGVHPYVCMDYFETVTLINTAFIPADNESMKHLLSSESVASDPGLDNSAWTSEMDVTLIEKLYGKLFFTLPS